MTAGPGGTDNHNRPLISEDLECSIAPLLTLGWMGWGVSLGILGFVPGASFLVGWLTPLRGSQTALIWAITGKILAASVWGRSGGGWSRVGWRCWEPDRVVEATG